MNYKYLRIHQMHTLVIYKSTSWQGLSYKYIYSCNAIYIYIYSCNASLIKKTLKVELCKFDWKKKKKILIASCNGTCMESSRSSNFDPL